MQRKENKPGSSRRCKCPRCRYVWKPRVPHPRECPQCKTRLGWPKPMGGK